METSALDSVLVPEIGKYHLVAELARGGMGIVHLASVQGPGGFHKLLVLKELKPEFSRDDDYVSMFLDEARLAAQLTHPNIVQTIEVGSEGGRHFMVMEFLDGRSLYRVIRRFREQGGLPVGAHLRVICEALLGIHYAHELADMSGRQLGVVHRDVSPLNVFVTFDGQAKVLDFGIAKSNDSSLETKTGTLKGRVAYMAPEQAWGAKVDRRADLYSAGVMIWEAIAGRRLWPGMNDVQILARALREGPPPLSSVQPDCPEELEAICARALEKKPEDRYATAQDLREDLEAHLARRDDSMSMREVGALVGRVFADERRHMTALLEETISRVRGGPTSGVIPTLEVHVRGTPSGLPTMRDESSHVSSSRLALASSHAPPQFPAPPSTSNLGPPFAKPQTRRASGRTAFLATGAAALLIPLILAFRAGSNGFAPAAHGDAVPIASSSSPPLPGIRDSPELIELVVRASPTGAQLTIDGAPVPTNPFHARYATDSLVHHVSASADGFEPRVVDVTFVHDTSVDLSLERHALPATVRYFAPAPVGLHAGKHSTTGSQTGVAPAASDPTPGPSGSPATTRVDVSPTGGHAPLRSIVTSNPYGT